MEANDMATMREALVNLNRWLFIGVDGYVHGQPDKTGEIERTIKSALAAPARNCDVGTADEQSERFENFCLKYIGCAEETGGRHCVGCPLEKSSRHITQKCELYWAQMPYEGGAK